jgi:hypothetical protein
MQDPRWSDLKQRLLANGWVWRDDTLYAPHATLWFQTSSDDPDYASFRDRMTIARDATATSAEADYDHAALHADLVSLVTALDEVLSN